MKMDVKNYSPPVVLNMIEFLYGLELNLSISLKYVHEQNRPGLEVFKELIDMAGVYDVEGLQDEVAVTRSETQLSLESQLSKENIFDFQSFCYTHKAKEAWNKCS